MHVSAINGLLIEKRAPLQRLLDLYLSGEFQKDILIDKKTVLEKSIADLECERAALLAKMRAQDISAEQQETLIEFARKIAGGLDCADSNFHTRRGIIEALGVEAILDQEENSKTLRIKCWLGSNSYVLSPHILGELSDKQL